MARRRRRTKKPESTDMSPSSMAQRSSAIAEATAGRVIPDHELTVLGFSNINRYFDLDDPNNGPAVVYRRIDPYACFLNGFNSVDDISDPHQGAAYDAGLTYNDPLYAMTPYAQYIESDVWPILTNLFSIGTGTRYAVGFSEFVRYNAFLLRAYAWLLIPLTINNLTYHFDWSKVAPFTDAVPAHLYTIAENLNASDTGIVGTWLPLMRRLDSKVAFPRILAEVKRNLIPMLSIDLNGRLQVPMVFSLATTTAETVYNSVTQKLDYLDVDLADAGAVFSSFLPFPFKDQLPWALPSGPVIDVDRDSGWFNSAVKDYLIYGDTGDPDVGHAMICDEGGDNTTLHFTRHCQTTWAELKMASVWAVTDELVDDLFWLLTMHHYGNVEIIDDSFDYFTYDGTEIDHGEAGFRYLDFVNSRFASYDVDYGVQKPGLQGSEVFIAPINRMMRVQCSYDFCLEILKNVTASMAGASLRELRYTIASMVQFGLSQPV